IIELSSFQLAVMSNSPTIAAVLNITPNHLDRHGTIEAYMNAKLKILANQSKNDIAILNREDPGAWALAEKVAGILYSFGKETLKKNQFGTFVQGSSIWIKTKDEEKEIMPIAEIQLLGEHNLMNILAAVCIADRAGFSVESIRSGVIEFTGAPHRLEFVRTWQGTNWYNDSKATTPAMAIKAIQSFDEPLIVLAGGRDKNLPWQDFAEVIKEKNARLILFGEAAQMILDQFTREISPEIIVAEGLAQAIQQAVRLCAPGDIVLLAPGGTSYDEFENYADRGNQYKSWVNTLKDRDQ
ncbi:MAG: UDP-N-acetylmuramoyl-L-alanine--D-glutamate ligase, partial [Chloroflexota bacterium]